MQTIENILLIDDDEDALLSLARILKTLTPNIHIQAAINPQKALDLIRETSPSVVVMDLCLDEKQGPSSGFELLQKITQQDPTIRVIVLTGYGSVEAGVKCISLGAANFLEKPPEPSHLAALIKDGITQQHLKRAFLSLKSTSSDLLSQMIIGESDQAKKIKDEIQYASQTNQPVLITGETGTGKGLAALAIHKFSKRSQRKFIRYQPTFGAHELVSSELFGHKKGAFTGAEADRTGLIEEANGGTLFLDEIDELPLEIQVTLLGVLQDKKVRRLGGNSEVEADFRLISATNQHIEEKIKDKKVRADFFHRIGHLQIHLPALRERSADIPLLVEAKIRSLTEKEDVRVIGIDKEAINKLKNYSWPGNIRELEAVIEGGAYRAQYRRSNFIETKDLNIAQTNLTDSHGKTPKNFQESVEDFKIQLIEESLLRHEGNQVKAARELGMERSTLRRIIGRNKN